ncbi:MAG: hypothetical protein RSD42_06455, partial [Oscillospiraceae bacterium]
AITSYVDAVGKYSLLLKATPKSSNVGYKIVNKSLDFIDVYFDVLKEIEMSITPDIVISDKLIYSDEYISDKEVLSTDKITISGPATEVNKISKVIARINVPAPLKTTQSFPAELSITDAYGESLKYLKVHSNEKNITITIPVYKIAEFPVNVEFKNSPIDYLKNTLGIVASPAYIKIAAAEDVIQNMTFASVGTIDFNNINIGKNTFTFNKNEITNFKVLGDVSSISITVDASQMKSAKFKVKAKNISIVDSAAGYLATVEPSTINDVVIIGPESEIKNLTEDDIVAEIKLESKKLTEGKQLVPAQIVIKNGKCWAFGNYKALINVVEE